MRVAVVTESFLPQINGVTNSVLRVLDHLRDRGHDAIVIAPDDRELPTQVAGFPVFGQTAVSLPRYRTFRVGLPLPARLRRLLDRFTPEVLHAAAPFVLGHHAIGVARTLSVPVVAIYQTDVPGYASRYGFPQAQAALWRRIRSTHAMAARTLAPSSASRAQLLDHGVERVQLWRRGVDTERFHPRHRCESWRSQVAPGAERIIGYVGRLAPEKQVADLAVLSRIPGTRLVVIGDGPDRERIRARLPEAVFTGQLSGERLGTAMASLDVLVHPGELETFCQVIQEAHASGVPTVAPAKGGPLDLIRDGVTGHLYAPGDLTELHRRVAGLVLRPDVSAEMGRIARAGVQNKTWAHVGDELLTHYRLAARQSEPARAPTPVS